MRRWRFVVFASVAALGILALIAYPRGARCFFYKKMIASTSENLAAQPKSVEIACSEKTMPLSLGYAKTALPENWPTTVTVKGTAISIFAKNGAAVVFMPPVFDTTFSDDGNYSWSLAVARSKRQTLGAIFRMSSAEYDELIRHTFPKANNTFNQNGIGLFETERCRGIIRYGPHAEPGHINIEVWSKRGQVSQGILIHAPDADAAFRIVECVLFNLEYSIDRVPPAGTLRTSIRAALKAHHLFTENPRAG